MHTARDHLAVLIPDSASCRQSFCYDCWAGIAAVSSDFSGNFELCLGDELIDDADFGSLLSIVCSCVDVYKAARGLEQARHFRALSKIIIADNDYMSLAPESFEKTLRFLSQRLQSLPSWQFVNAGPFSQR